MQFEDLRFFNPYREVERTRHRLPHWQQHGATYFITFRLADSAPRHLMERWRSDREAWLRLNPRPWTGRQETEYHKRFTGAMEQWLDRGHGSCLLREPRKARLASDALLHFDGVRCAMVAFVVMPNHVHALFVPHTDWTLRKLLHSWKSFTSHEINRSGRVAGALWQRDYFDRLVRDQEHFAKCVRYIRRNPVKAGLREGEFVLWESSLVRGIP